MTPSLLDALDRARAPVRLALFERDAPSLVEQWRQVRDARRSLFGEPAPDPTTLDNLHDPTWWLVQIARAEEARLEAQIEQGRQNTRERWMLGAVVVLDVLARVLF